LYQVDSELAHIEERARQLAADEIQINAADGIGARAKDENIKERARLLAAEHASPRPLRRGGTSHGYRSRI